MDLINHEQRRAAVRIEPSGSDTTHDRLAHRCIPSEVRDRTIRWKRTSETCRHEMGLTRDPLRGSDRIRMPSDPCTMEASSVQAYARSRVLEDVDHGWVGMRADLCLDHEQSSMPAIDRPGIHPMDSRPLEAPNLLERSIRTGRHHPCDEVEHRFIGVASRNRRPREKHAVLPDRVLPDPERRPLGLQQRRGRLGRIGCPTRHLGQPPVGRRKGLAWRCGPRNRNGDPARRMTALVKREDIGRRERIQPGHISHDRTVVGMADRKHRRVQCSQIATMRCGGIPHRLGKDNRSLVVEFVLRQPFREPTESVGFEEQDQPQCLWRTEHRVGGPIVLGPCIVVSTDLGEPGVVCPERRMSGTPKPDVFDKVGEPGFARTFLGTSTQDADLDGDEARSRNLRRRDPDAVVEQHLFSHERESGQRRRGPCGHRDERQHTRQPTPLPPPARRDNGGRPLPEHPMDELIKHLKTGDVDAFNEARPRRGKLDLFAADLSEIQGAGADLSNAILEKADLTDADLTDAILARAILIGADLSDTKLGGVLALQSRWKEAYIEDTDLSDADLSASDFSDTELHGVSFQDATLASAKMKRANIQRCRFAGADLSEVRLTDATIADTDMSGCRLVEAKLQGVQASGINLNGADLTKARLSGAVLAGADLGGTRFVDADLSNADLSGARLQGADFTRADLSGVQFGDADLEGATFTDAQVEGPLLSRAMGDIPDAAHLLVEDPVIASGNGAVAVLWENPSAVGGRNWLRIAVGPRGKGPAVSPAAIPVPADLVVARALAPAPDGGFAVLVMLERPSGIASTLFPVSATGEIGEGRRLQIPYTPAARPILKTVGDELLLFGISREGPGLHVHRIGEGPEPESLHASLMKTVRGFVSDHHPVVLSKGGVLVTLGRRGPGQPMTAPGAFPDVRCAAAPIGKGLGMAWLPSQGLGLGVAEVASGVQGEEDLLLKKQPIGSLDAAADDDGAWAIFTKEPTEPGGAASAWAVELPDGLPFPVVEGPENDVTEVRMVADPSGALAAITLLDGGLVLYTLSGGKAAPVWRLE